MATTPGKDTIYVDVDDEITTIIDKVRSAHERVVALVLPKRAAVLQSTVNMKLLKKTADDAKKHVVLITSEPGLLPLAGSVGMYVASTLQSKPAIPNSGVDDSDDDEEAAVDMDKDFDAKAVAATPIGALAGMPDEPAKVTEEAETIELPDEPARSAPAAAAAASAPVQAAKAKAKKDKKLAVPNFNRFRLALVIVIILLLGLGGFGYAAATVLPKATIVVHTDTSDVTINENITLSTEQDSVNQSDGILPAKVSQQNKTNSQQVATTGQQNQGQRAHGSATITNCSDSSITLPAGTGLSNGGNTYITQQRLQLDEGIFDSRGRCRTSGSHVGQVNVTAQKPGASYNIDNGTTLTVASSSDGSYDASKLSAAANGTIGGGSDNNVQVVAQADIDNAKQKLTATDSNAIKQQLKQNLQNEGYVAIDATFTTGSPTVTTTANVGDQANNVTVTQATNYSMFGVKRSDLSNYLQAIAKKEIDAAKQSILDDGVNAAAFKLNGNATDTTAQVALSTKAVAGPQLNADTIKQQMAGKKSGEVKSALQSVPGVKSVDVNLSPFWVTSVPKNTSKVTVTFVKASDAN